MIRAVVFDLDGVLVQTEKLKALSYAMAVQQLLGLAEPDPRAIEAYREVVGESRETAANHIVEKLGLAGALSKRQKEYGGTKAFEVLIAVRMPIYDKMVADPKVIWQNRWPRNIALVRMVARMSCRTGVATMSTCAAAQLVLRSLHIAPIIDAIIGADDIKHGKPDPEVYLVAVDRLGVPPSDALAIEDSTSGVKAALAAGMRVVAVPTPFTESGFNDPDIVHKIGAQWIVRHPEDVAGTVRRRIESAADQR